MQSKHATHKPYQLSQRGMQTKLMVIRAHIYNKDTKRYNKSTTDYCSEVVPLILLERFSQEIECNCWAVYLEVQVGSAVGFTAKRTVFSMYICKVS